MGSEKGKGVQDSLVHNVEIVLPNDTNTLGILLGGRLLNWMDMAAAICAQIHAEGPCVTVNIDEVNFKHALRIGDLVHIHAYVTRSFTHSLEIAVRVWQQRVGSNEKVKTHDAFFTFVAMDEMGKPKTMPELIPQTDQEQMDWKNAGERKKRKNL